MTWFHLDDNVFFTQSEKVLSAKLVQEFSSLTKDLRRKQQPVNSRFYMEIVQYRIKKTPSLL